MKKSKIFRPIYPFLSLLFLAFLFSPHTTHAQSGKKKKVRVNGRTVEHKERDGSRMMDNCDNSPFRTIDGTCNNQSTQNRLEWGATDIQLRREMAADYGEPDDLNDMAGQDRESARAISNACVAQNEDIFSSENLSSFIFAWGQFIDHDIDLTPEDHIEYEPILLPADEPDFSSDIPFFRSAVHEGTGDTGPRQQTNLITAWIDASMVYGSDEDRASWLRTFEDGQLKTSSGDRLPFNTIDGEYDSDIDPDAPSMAGEDGSTKLFVAGDVRANEQVALTALHTLFVREHNRICDQLMSQGMTNDEQIYQVARKWVGAYMQAITYEEFLPALGIEIPDYSGYKQNTRPDISNVFATAAFRIGHTMVPSELLLRNDQCEEVGDGAISLVDAFFSVDPIREHNIAPFLKGLSVQTQMEIDNYIVDELRNFLFAVPGSPVPFGLDLASLNIQRGRDHGLRSYNQIRNYFNISSAPSFAHINPDPLVYNALADAYDSVHDMDAWVGMLAEQHLPGKSVGPSHDRILGDQFRRLRDGDYFYYEKDEWFNGQQKNQIRNTSLSEIIERNTDLDQLSNNVFVAEDCDTQSGPGGGGPGGGGNNGGGNNGPGGGHGGGGRTADLTFGSADMESGLTVFPNPSNGEMTLTLNAPETTSANLRIMDASGRMVMNQILTGFNDNFQMTLDLGNQSSGIYFLQVKTDKEVFARRLIVE